MLEKVTAAFSARLPIHFGVIALMLSAASSFAADWQPPATDIKITSKKSIVHMGSVDSTSLTEDGIKAAKLVLDYLNTKNVESAKTARKIYDKIIPRENYGGDYTALQWLIDASIAPAAEKPKYLGDKYAKSYYDFFADNDFAQLKEYLKRKYKLENLKDADPAAGLNRRQFLEDFILFNNPRRPEWEKTGELVKSLNIKPGMKIADVGSGPGFFSFQFAELVGPKGKVFSIDTVKEHLDYIKNFTTKNNINNIELIQTTDHTIGMAGKESVDVAYMCSLYHIVYVTFKEEAKDEFINSIYNALKKDGTFYVVDNGLVPDGVLPYHAPYIDKDLIIGQLQHYGFRLVRQYQFIPQRFILEFKKM